MPSNWVLLSQGMTRPGIVSGQHWGKPFPRSAEPDPYRVRPEWVDTHMQFSVPKVEQMVRLNGVGPWVSASGVVIARQTPARRPNPRLSNPEMR